MPEMVARLAEALPGGCRALLMAHGDPAEVLASLIEDMERLTLTDLPAAVAGTAVLAQTADALDDARSRIRARRARAQALSYSNRFSEALTVLDEASQIARQHSEISSRELAVIDLTRLHALARLGRFEEAVEAGKSARDTLLDLGEALTAAKADVNLGVVQRMRNRPAEALSHFDRAMPLFAEQPVIAAQIQSNRAEALLDMHEFDAAQDAFESALATFEGAGVQHAAAVVEGNLGDLMGRQGRLAAALRRFENARRRIEKEGSPGDVARLQAEAAEVQLELGLPDDAARASADAAEVLDQHGLAAESARARLNLGRSLAALHRPGEAQRELARAEAQFQAASHPLQAARAGLARAELMLSIGNATEARDAVSTLLAAFADCPADAAAAHALLAAIELRLGEPRRAIEWADAGLVLAESLDLAPLIGELLHVRGKALVQLGRIEEATCVLDRAMDQAERIRSSLQADRFRTAFHAQWAPLYGDAVAAVLQADPSKRASRAFAIVERARSRALLDLLGGALATAPAKADLVTNGDLAGELGRWRARLNALYTGWHDAGGSGRLAADWQREIGEAEQRISDIESRLASTMQFSGLFAEPVSLDALFQLMPAGTVLLEYFIAGGRVLAFIIRGQRAPEVVNLCPFDEVLPALERLQFQIARALSRGSSAAVSPRTTADCHRACSDLHRLLLGPVESRLDQCSRLFIAPFGPLHAVPFHALRSEHGFLVERFEVVYTPSASIMVRAGAGPEHRPSGPPLLVAFADERAPGMEDEVRALADILPHSRLLTQDRATVAEVLRQAAGISLLHIAAHGVFSSIAPATSGVRLADGWLTAREACSLPLRGTTVTLSGCETGRSAATGGDELLGLIRAFLAAGARSVLVSLWSVHDQTATELLASTYRSWYLDGEGSKNLPLSAALRSAQMGLLHRGVHPAYWAPFFVVGSL